MNCWSRKLLYCSLGASLALACAPPGTLAGGSEDPESAVRYLALGDSYTVGEGVAPEQSFPAQLVTLLRARSESVSDPEVIARTGWTVDEMLEGVEQRSPAGPYDLVTLLIGVNDQYRGYEVGSYEEEFERALATAVNLAGGDASNVVVLSIPDWGVSEFAEGRDRARIAAEIDLYNAIARRSVEEAGAAWVDITRFSREATDPSMFVDDRLHPSAMAYGEWARLAVPAARAALD